MAREILTSADVPESVSTLVDPAVLDTVLAGLNSRALRLAPCLEHGEISEAKMILIGVIQRWAAAGVGAWQQQTSGPFTVTTDTRQKGGYTLWPSEVQSLQEICGGSKREAFSITPTSSRACQFPPLCDLDWSKNGFPCSCGSE